MFILIKLQDNLKNSLNGLYTCLSEIAFKLEIAYGFTLLILISFLDFSQTHTLILIIEYFLLLAFELINTAIEKTCNRITREHDLLVRDAKDLGSAAVFLILILNIGSLLYFIIFF
jgi:diacylglycerol kinase (ATP)